MSVSVLIPVYNAEGYLVQAVESALAQPETSEIILVEDGSTDNSLAVCQQLAAKHPIIKVYQHENGENRGEAASRNLLLEQAAGEYLAFLDADDYFLPDRFKRALEIFRTETLVDVVYEAFEIFYENKDMQATHIQNTTSDKRLEYLAPVMRSEELFRFLMTQKNGSLGMPTLVIRKSCLPKLPRFNETLKTAPDAPMMLQMTALLHCAAGEINRPVFMYRQHGTNHYAGTPEKNPQKARKVWLEWTQYFWHWACETLDEQQQEYVSAFLIRQVWRTAIWRKLSMVRPRAVFFKLHLLLMMLLLPTHYQGLLYTKTYWRQLGKALIGQLRM